MRKLLLITASLAANAALAVSGPADGGLSMDAFLVGLAQIAPPARIAADYYRQGFAARCGRPLTVLELRHAFSDGNGEPVLMRMVHAAALEDGKALRELAATIACHGGGQ